MTNGREWKNIFGGFSDSEMFVLPSKFIEKQNEKKIIIILINLECRKALAFFMISFLDEYEHRHGLWAIYVAKWANFVYSN